MMVEVVHDLPIMGSNFGEVIRKTGMAAMEEAPMKLVDSVSLSVVAVHVGWALVDQEVCLP